MKVFALLKLVGCGKQERALIKWNFLLTHFLLQQLKW